MTGDRPDEQQAARRPEPQPPPEPPPPEQVSPAATAGSTEGRQASRAEEPRAPDDLRLVSPSGPVEGTDHVERDLPPEELTDRTPTEIRDLAKEKGFTPYGERDSAGNYRKFKDLETGTPRLRIDQGHVDQDGRPYNDPRAAVPHAHGYDADGQPVVDQETKNKHFPLRSEKHDET